MIASFMDSALNVFVICYIGLLLYLYLRKEH